VGIELEVPRDRQASFERFRGQMWPEHEQLPGAIKTSFRLKLPKNWFTKTRIEMTITASPIDDVMIRRLAMVRVL
jgi:hypothetical protein